MSAGLHVITGRIDIARHAIAGGAGIIQYRDKQCPGRELVETARAMLQLCRQAGATLIINDRPDIALAIGACGVHLGQHDLPVGAAREILGPNSVIGASASTVRQAVDAMRAGADYVGFGHIYATASKHKDYEPRGLRALREVCATVTVPVIAIGGITTANAAEIMVAGAAGLAVIGAVEQSSDPRDTVRTLHDIVAKSRTNS